MSAREILHIGYAEKFLPKFIELVNAKINVGIHRFLVFGKLDDVEHFENVSTVSSSLQLFKAIRSADQVILHGLFGVRLLFTLKLMPRMLKKCYWVMWGADLYSGLLTKSTVRTRFVNWFRRSIVKNIGHLITYVEGDFELAERLYGGNAIRHNCIVYPSNTFSVDDFPQYVSKIQKTTNILVGNSAAITNNHFEILSALENQKTEDIKIYCPLSYGDQIHGKLVADEGQRIFGEKFIPLLDFLPTQEYQEMLSIIDIAIFAHKRQQAMGNTISLIGLGAKVFMRKDVTQYAFLNGIGAKIYNVENFDLKPLAQMDKEHNRKIITDYFSEEKLIDQLLAIFRGKI